MQKHILTTALLLLSLAVVVPGTALAAFNNVVLPVGTTFVLTGPDPDITLTTITATANLNNIIIYPGSIEFILERDANGNSSITLSSAAKNPLNNTGGVATLSLIHI